MSARIDPEQHAYEPAPGLAPAPRRERPVWAALRTALATAAVAVPLLGTGALAFALQSGPPAWSTPAAAGASDAALATDRAEIVAVALPAGAPSQAPEQVADPADPAGAAGPAAPAAPSESSAPGDPADPAAPGARPPGQAPADPPAPASPDVAAGELRIGIDTRGYQDELDACLWVRMDLGGAVAPIVGAHNHCGGDVVLDLVDGDRVRLAGEGLDGVYVVTGSRDGYPGQSAREATAGMDAAVILQTCYWDRDEVRLVTLLPAREGARS
ncbi:hypothetical protein [Microbacterium album]|uniref:Uncharacterized protein n=1 Tax=Microbacterium album TaxID=2053191 RepID=A0A917IJI8_9MICO|nr:hypothetical protein [Microbacterium album]GGH51037.1 hypothetical protein GCM10010921_30220 [Microbacterium album]